MLILLIFAHIALLLYNSMQKLASDVVASCKQYKYEKIARPDKCYSMNIKYKNYQSVELPLYAFVSPTPPSISIHGFIP